MKDYRIDGPIPVTLRATENGAEVDVTRFLFAVLAELCQQAAEDPEGVGQDLADLGGLIQSAAVQGRDSHARHEADERMHGLIDGLADGGSVPLYATGLRQLRDAVVELTAPRPVPAQGRRTA